MGTKRKIQCSALTHNGERCKRNKWINGEETSILCGLHNPTQHYVRHRPHPIKTAFSEPPYTPYTSIASQSIHQKELSILELRLIQMVREHDITAEMVLHIQRTYAESPVSIPRPPSSVSSLSLGSESPRYIHSCAIM